MFRRLSIISLKFTQRTFHQGIFQVNFVLNGTIFSLQSCRTLLMPCTRVGGGGEGRRMSRSKPSDNPESYPTHLPLKGPRSRSASTTGASRLFATSLAKETCLFATCRRAATSLAKETCPKAAEILQRFKKGGRRSTRSDGGGRAGCNGVPRMTLGQACAVQQWRRDGLNARVRTTSLSTVSPTDSAAQRGTKLIYFSLLKQTGYVQNIHTVETPMYTVYIYSQLHRSHPRIARARKKLAVPLPWPPRACASLLRAIGFPPTCRHAHEWRWPNIPV